jgi:hypothetical protein
MSNYRKITKVVAALAVAAALGFATVTPAEAASNRANGVRANGVSHSAGANGV